MRSVRSRNLNWNASGEPRWFVIHHAYSTIFPSVGVNSTRRLRSSSGTSVPGSDRATIPSSVSALARSARVPLATANFSASYPRGDDRLPCTPCKGPVSAMNSLTTSTLKGCRTGSCLEAESAAGAPEPRPQLWTTSGSPHCVGKAAAPRRTPRSRACRLVAVDGPAEVDVHHVWLPRGETGDRTERRRDPVGRTAFKRIGCDDHAKRRDRVWGRHQRRSW